MTSRGFTLVEVLVALVIVGFVSVSALAAVGAASRASDRAAMALVASELAEERLASLLTVPPASLADAADGIERDVAGLDGWRWSASIDSREGRLVIVSVRAVGPGAEAERRALRPGDAR